MDYINWNIPAEIRIATVLQQQCCIKLSHSLSNGRSLSVNVLVVFKSALTVNSHSEHIDVQLYQAIKLQNNLHFQFYMSSQIYRRRIIKS